MAKRDNTMLIIGGVAVAGLAWYFMAGPGKKAATAVGGGDAAKTALAIEQEKTKQLEIQKKALESQEQTWEDVLMSGAGSLFEGAKGFLGSFSL
jgi:hypothetical protein